MERKFIKMNQTKDAAKAEWLSALASIYESVPSGRCLGCTNCCSESVNVSFLEFANIIENGVRKLSDATLSELKQKVIAYYLKEWLTPMKCPFLSEDKRCIIYEVRPLPCRIFGTPTRGAYEANFTRIRQQNLSVAKAIKSSYNLLLPMNVIRRKIDFCEAFIPEKRLTESMMDRLYGKLINLDGKLYFEGLIDEKAVNGDLVGWMVDWIIAEDADRLITKELLYDLKLEMLKSVQIK